METYYKPEDLPRFEQIGKEVPELAKKFFEYYGAVFAEVELSEREKALICLLYTSDAADDLYTV